MDIKEMRKIAREKMMPKCRMCPVCDGKVCAGEIPGMGGVGSGNAFANNIKALAEIQLRQRIIHSVTEPDTTLELWGRQLAMPILAAPIGGISFNVCESMTDVEYAESVVLACRNYGSMAMTGDSKIPTIYPSGLAAIQQVEGWGIPTIKPRPNELIIEMAEQAREIGATAVAIDVDAAALVNMTSSGQPVGPKSFTELKELKANIKLPLIIKGIMDLDDADNCAAAGIDGIVVSNHGGRVLDYTPGTARCLPAIARRYGNYMKIFVDGGVRNGFDVLKMLALGADAVLLGRPIAQAAMAGTEGVKCLLESYHKQLQAAMIMTGCLNLNEVTKDIIFKEK